LKGHYRKIEISQIDGEGVVVPMSVQFWIYPPQQKFGMVLSWHRETRVQVGCPMVLHLGIVHWSPPTENCASLFHVHNIR